MEQAAAGRLFYLESYGCQMNFSDSEIVASILHQHGFGLTRQFQEADLILLNTCAIRDNAEQRVRNRLQELRTVKKQNRSPHRNAGLHGRTTESTFAGGRAVGGYCLCPDAYRDLPQLVASADSGQKAVNVLLSRERETYSDIAPLRLDANGVTGFISIMRGCDNMCSFVWYPLPADGREAAMPSP